MVFKRLRQVMGSGRPAVETTLRDPGCHPGGQLDGWIHITGGDHEVAISGVALALVTRVEVETGDTEYDTTQEFHRHPVTGQLRLAPGQRQDIPFVLQVPWQTPLTELHGQPLHGVTVGLRTELAVIREVDHSDVDPLVVRPLPAQEQILDALFSLGFRLLRSDVERGHLYGVHQNLPFYQELEFAAGPGYAHAMRQLEVIFVADAERMQVILEIDKRGGVFIGTQESFGHHTVDYTTVASTDWPAELDSWLSQSLRLRDLPRRG